MGRRDPLVDLAQSRIGSWKGVTEQNEMAAQGETSDGPIKLLEE